MLIVAKRFSLVFSCPRYSLTRNIVQRRVRYERRQSLALDVRVVWVVATGILSLPEMRLAVAAFRNVTALVSLPWLHLAIAAFRDVISNSFCWLLSTDLVTNAQLHCHRQQLIQVDALSLVTDLLLLLAQVKDWV